MLTNTSNIIKQNFFIIRYWSVCYLQYLQLHQDVMDAHLTSATMIPLSSMDIVAGVQATLVCIFTSFV